MRLVLDVTDRLQLEGAVLDVKVLAEALAQTIQHLCTALIIEHRVLNDDVDAEHR